MFVKAAVADETSISVIRDKGQSNIESQMQESETEITRRAIHPINPLILNRWSPRSMTGEELKNEDIMSLFEAARWAPSSYNNQPWRFIYAKR
ncbi:MAG: nitroreductase family protein, partial [Nitrososphaeraceae archaeon]|nr:nitroreductase family protein [Nitrososphaeraceae archaeon]